jgi:hypothetical protein
MGVVAILGATWIVGTALGSLMLRVGTRAWIAVLGAACFVGSVIGLLAIYTAIAHNPQGAFIDHESGAINYLDLFLIFLSWFVVFGVAAGLAFMFLVWVFRGLPRKAFIRHPTGSVNYLGLTRIFLSWLVAVSAATGLILMLLVWS